MNQRFHFDTVLRFVSRSPRWIGENPFLGFLALLCLALLISSIVFYRYVFVARNEDVGGEITQIRLGQEKLQQVIQTWQERAEKFDQAGTTQVRDIFSRPAKILEETEI
ncbi:MAG TPA: hypothetical protein VJC15_04095 [Candidatus Paceibacterota bacterium]